MTRRRSHIIALIAILFVAGCGGALNVAQKTVSVAAAVGVSAGELAISIDKQRQESIEAQLALDHDIAKAERFRAQWRLDRLEIDKALKTYKLAVDSGATLVALAGKKFDFVALVSALTQAYQALKTSLDAYGIKLPGGL